MKNKVQFLDSYGSFHQYNFIKTVLPNYNITIYSDTGYHDPSTCEISDYYKEHNISLEYANKFKKIKVPFLKHILNLFSGIIMIIKSRKENYDFCFIHYLSQRRAILSLFIPKTTKVFLITYGSDILRRKNFNDFFFKRMLSRASLIDFTSGNLRYKFESVYKLKYENKSVDIPFPCAPLKKLDFYIDTISKFEAKKHFEFPADKSIVVCGHTATINEQFEKLIESLEKVDEKILNLCYFVFPMTYGTAGYKDYIIKIKQKLECTKMSFKILENYLPYDEMAMLHIASDIHITTISTDALSFFMLEEMYAGSTIIYGEWLHYVELENDSLSTNKFKNFSDLPIVFSNTILGLKEVNLAKQKEYLLEITSNREIRSKWEELLK